MPKDINYADGQGMINLYALNTDKTIRANGSCDQFIVGGSAEAKNDSVGPSSIAISTRLRLSMVEM